MTYKVMDKTNQPNGNAPDHPDDNNRVDQPSDDQRDDQQSDKRGKPRVVGFDLVGYFGNDLLVIEEEEF